MPTSTPPNHVIRPAVPSDEPFLLALTNRLAAFPLPAWRTAGEIAAADQPILLEALRRPTPTTLLLVAEQPPGVPAGCVFVATTTDYFTRAPSAHVEIVAVTPEAEGSGLGRVLLDQAEDWARRRGYRQITLNVFATNTRARAVYAHLEYQPETLRYRKGLGDEPAKTPKPSPT
jgi:GNAT superfamily N-acetyltransferase